MFPDRAAQPDTQTLTEQAFTLLQEDILNCRLKPGEKLRLRDLCNTYNIGANPLREALSRLASTGLVVAHGQRGFFVAEVSVDDLIDLTKTRVWVEALALRTAIRCGDRDWEANILASAHRLGVTSPTDHQAQEIDKAQEKFHRDFHAALVSACSSNYLLGFWGALFDGATRYRRWMAINLQFPQNPRGGADHEAIMNAVLARDEDRAIGLMCQHIIFMPRKILASDPRTAADADYLVAQLCEDVNAGDQSANLDPASFSSDADPETKSIKH